MDPRDLEAGANRAQWERALGAQWRRRLARRRRKARAPADAAQSDGEQPSDRPHTDVAAGEGPRISTLLLPFDVRGLLSAMESGALIRAVIGTVMQIAALVLSALFVKEWIDDWKRVDSLPGGQVALFATWQVFLLYAVFLAVAVTALRGQHVKRMPDSEFVVTPIVAVLIRLQGEIAFVFAGALSVPLTLISWAGGRELADLLRRMPTSLRFNDEIGTALSTFVACWISGFVALLVTRALAELLTAVFAIARDVNVMRRAKADTA